MEGKDVLAGERRTRRTLLEVKRELNSCAPAGVQVGRPIRVRRESAPADLKKDADGFDLSVALRFLRGSGCVAIERTGSFAIFGGVALIGELGFFAICAARFAGRAARRRRKCSPHSVPLHDAAPGVIE